MRTICRTYVLCLVALSVAWSVQAQIAFDAEAAMSTGSQDTTQQWTHTPVGTPDCGVVVIIQSDETDIVTDVTWGAGNSMTRVVHVGHGPTEDETGGVYLYFLDGVPAGAQTITVTKSAAVGSIASSYSLTAATTNECSVEGSNSGEGTSTDPSVAVTTGSGVETWGIAGLFSGRNGVGDVSAGNSWTMHVANDGGSITRFTERLTANDAGSGFTADFSIAFSDDYAIAAAAITESGGATNAGASFWLQFFGASQR